METRARFYVCGRILIIRDDKVLMGKEISPDDPGWCMWETPGGGLRPGETLEECLAREALEEIGTEIRIRNELPRFRCLTQPIPGQDASDATWLMVFCRCDPVVEPALSRAPDNEFVELRYVDQTAFRELVRQGVVAVGHEVFLPEIMSELGLWN